MTVARGGGSTGEVRSVSAAICAAALCMSGPSQADPQVSVGMVAGVAANGNSSDRFREVAGAVGLRADALFGRNRDAEMAVGPYVEAMTMTGFDDLQVGVGGVWLVPIEPLAAVLSVGPYERSAWGRWRAGLASELFVGSRSLNYHAWYGLAAGLVVQGRFDLDSVV